MKISELLIILDGMAPFSLAEEWDNVGLIIGRKDVEVSKVMVCLDVTAEAVKKAAVEKAHVIISHHPVIFDPVRTITDDLILEIIENSISVIAMHTNYDCARLNCILADRLGLEGREGIMVTGQGTGFLGIKGRFNKPLSPEEVIAHVGKVFDTEKMRITGNPGREIISCGIAGGGVGDYYKHIMDLGLDVFITGEVKYNNAVALSNKGCFVIEAGHYETEKHFIDDTAGILSDGFNTRVIMHYQDIQKITGSSI
jgi:dinuclear metal center YbgI/SA1388 family protein